MTSCQGSHGEIWSIAVKRNIDKFKVKDSTNDYWKHLFFGDYRPFSSMWMGISFMRLKLLACFPPFHRFYFRGRMTRIPYFPALTVSTVPPLNIVYTSGSD